MAITTPAYHVLSKQGRRLQAVLALFRGASASRVSTQFQISRSDLYKFRVRVLAAMCEALRDPPRGPKRPHNRLAPQREQAVVSFCQRYPTLSSYQVQQRLGTEAPHPRTIQRVRKRSGLARLLKRALPSLPGTPCVALRHNTGSGRHSPKTSSRP